VPGAKTRGSPERSSAPGSPPIASIEPAAPGRYPENQLTQGRLCGVNRYEGLGDSRKATFPSGTGSFRHRRRGPVKTAFQTVEGSGRPDVSSGSSELRASSGNAPKRHAGFAQEGSCSTRASGRRRGSNPSECSILTGGSMQPAACGRGGEIQTRHGPGMARGAKQGGSGGRSPTDRRGQGVVDHDFLRLRLGVATCSKSLPAVEQTRPRRERLSQRASRDWIPGPRTDFHRLSDGIDNDQQRDDTTSLGWNTSSPTTKTIRDECNTAARPWAGRGTSTAEANKNDGEVAPAELTVLPLRVGESS